MRILAITSSLPSPESVSRSLFEQVIARLKQVDPSSTFEMLDLTQEVVPHWSEREIAAAFTTAEARSPEQLQALKLSDRYCQQLLAADVIVISSPMWNFSIPSRLKAWIDHIVRVNVTFQMGPAGSEGLLKRVKRVILVEASGGNYQAAEARALNHVAPYLERVFRFMGAQEVSTISAQGTVIDRAQAIQRAREQIDRIEL
jgi:FMN-dependent NADH-azoreductase